MGIFGTSSPFDQYVDKATSEKNVCEDWSQIMDICDKVKDSLTGPKDCMKSISKKLNSDNPRVALQAITLLDACVSNCGKRFLLEVAAREFEQDLLKLITGTKTHAKVSARLRESLKKWAEGEFKGDPELSLIPALYNKLLKEGYDFETQAETTKKTVKYSNDPNVVNNQQEEEDIAKAIQMSLQDSGSTSSYKGSQGPRTNTSGTNTSGTNTSGTNLGLYSSASAALNATPSSPPEHVDKEPLKVRALYDFEAAEDNELTFKIGEIIIVIDNSDANWWKGTNHRGEGLFPANFVTTNLEGDAEHSYKSESNKKVSFSDCVEVTEVEDTPSETTEEVSGEINEDKIDQLLHLLHEADPTGERPDDPLLPILEEHVNAMAPNIDAELERIDKKHAQLSRISTDLVDALNLYHQLMREMPSSMPYYAPYSKGLPMPPGMMLPPHYMPPNSMTMQQQTMYGPPGQMNNNFVGAPFGGMPPYMPPSQVGQGQPFPPHMQQMPPTSHIGVSGPPGFNQYPPVNPDFNRMPPDSNNSSPRNSGMPNSFQGVPMNMPPHVPQHHGGPPISMAPQGPPISMAPPGHPMPHNMQQGGSLSMIHPPTSNMMMHSHILQQPVMLPQEPPSMLPQGHVFPPVSHPQHMQQPLL